MTKEEKELLFKDLCARLPYGVKCKITTIKKEEIETSSPEQVGVFKRNNCKIYPYLRPKSSMTLEEKKEYDNLRAHICDDYNRYCFDTYKSIDWLNAHHFDYRGLIEKGLALEAPEGMYN